MSSACDLLLLYKAKCTKIKLCYIVHMLVHDFDEGLVLIVNYGAKRADFILCSAMQMRNFIWVKEQIENF